MLAHLKEKTQKTVATAAVCSKVLILLLLIDSFSVALIVFVVVLCLACPYPDNFFGFFQSSTFSQRKAIGTKGSNWFSSGVGTPWFQLVLKWGWYQNFNGNL